MDKNLANLVSAYQESVRFAVSAIHRSGIPLPSSCDEWIGTDIPQRGELAGGIRYAKHGFGCAVELPTGAVDFDFGELGEIDGFNVGRLAGFAGLRLTAYGFPSRTALQESFNAAVNSGLIIYSGYVLYYEADRSPFFAVDLLRR